MIQGYVLEACTKYRCNGGKDEEILCNVYERINATSVNTTVPLLDNWNGEMEELAIIGKSRLGNCNNVGDKWGFMKRNLVCCEHLFHVT